MTIDDDYLFSTKFMYMTSVLNSEGKPCTEITETTGTFIIDKPITKVINNGVIAAGVDLTGVLETSKWLLGDVPLCPIMVNPVYQIVLFPTHSPKSKKTIWFSPTHIRSTSGTNRRTDILFNNGQTKTAPVRVSFFNTVLNYAKKLRTMDVDSVDKPFCFMIDPKDRFKSRN